MQISFACMDSLWSVNHAVSAFSGFKPFYENRMAQNKSKIQNPNHSFLSMAKIADCSDFDRTKSISRREMAEVVVKYQAKEYADARPSYPPQLFQFIASKTPSHNLVWDVATGSGQAAKSLAALYKNVIATDVSEKQLEFATKLPNVRYQHTPSTMSMAELEQMVAPQGTIDLVTIGTALHWFDLPTFYEQVKWVLKKPHGVIAAWTYIFPRVSEAVDAVFDQLYFFDSKPYWNQKRELVVNKYRSIDFPFEPLDGADHTGPFEFVTDTVMDFDDLLTFIKSWSAYQAAKEQGVELLREDVVDKFKLAWGEDVQRVAKFPIYLRIGRVGDA